MSSLCQTSHSILALHNSDLDGLSLIPTANNLHEALIERQIDIKLECIFTDASPGNCNDRLDVISWNRGSDNLCGICSFCKMFADGTQRSIKSDKWYGWNLSSNYDIEISSAPSVMRATIHFEKLQYQKHSTPQTVDKQRAGYWDVSLLLLDGHVLLYPEHDKNPIRIEVPLAFELFGEEDDPVAQLLGIHRRPFHGPRLSDENTAKMHHWMDDCTRNHDRCTLKSIEDQEVTSYIPTRLVYIGGHQHPRLIITSEMPARASKAETIKYIALSYCWGKLDSGNKLLKTTHDTIHSRTEDIEMATMPPTFQDAITVARKLGFQYIWIDSLCIIQDDIRDWQMESSRMAEIFSNAYLTLIVATGSGCNDSFLDRGLPGLSCTVPLSLNERPGHLSLRFRPHRGPYDKMTEMRASKWVDRGWTFQEERLAKRSLIFGERKFFFDCRSVERSQDTDRYLARPDWVTSVVEGLGEGRAGSTELSRRYDHWQTLCSHYSYRELSFAEDKLPAISGMASLIGKKVKSDYLAGLWKENLMHDLFWNTIKSRTINSRILAIKHERSERYRAPSWSWASIDGKTKWPLHCDTAPRAACVEYCTILDAKTTLFGLDPYGAVKDGFMKVQGVTEEMEVIGSVQEDLRDWKLCHRGDVFGSVDLDIEDSLNNGTKVYHALLMVGCKSYGESNLAMRGLLLKKASLRRDGHEVFERAGTFDLLPGVVPGKRGSGDVWDRSKEQIIIII